MLAASVISDSIMMPDGPDKVDFVMCECCSLSEECTPSYIHTIRQRYGGKWICGLCAEAVKYEALRCQNLDEALARHLSNIRAPRDHPNLTFIRAITHVLRKRTSLDTPKLIMPTTKTGEQPLLMPPSIVQYNNKIASDNIQETMKEEEEEELC